MHTSQDTFARYSLTPHPNESELLKQGVWKGRLLVDYVDEHARTDPNRAAIVERNGTLTYKEFCAKTRNLAAALVKLGVKRGDVVAVQCPNWSELPISHFALDRIGAVFLPLHEGFRESEMTHLLKLSGAKVLIHPSHFHGFDYRGLIAKVRLAIPALATTIVMRSNTEGSELGFDALANDSTWISKEAPGFLESYRARSTEPLLIMVSSGTTGAPRCSVFCDDAVAVKLVEHFGKHAVQLRRTDRGAAIAPAGTGTTGYNYPILAALLNGATGVLLERWNGSDPGEALRLIAAHQCTYAVVIPTQLVKMVQCASAQPIDCSSLRFITYAGARLSDSIAAEAERLFGCPVQCVYGASDAGVPTMVTLRDAPEKRRTSGRVLAHEEVKLIDADGAEVKRGDAGEVCWRGANSGYGYLNDHKSEASGKHDGWHHSGDIGRFDDEGFLSIVGRKKDMIIRGGRNINPGKIEEVLISHPKIAEVAVIPIEDAVLGEIVCAVIVPSDHKSPPTLADLKECIKSAGLSIWYAPERLELAKELPRNAGGKIDKRSLIDSYKDAAALKWVQ